MCGAGARCCACVGCFVCKTSLELAPHELSDRRSVVFKARKSGTQGSFTRCIYFMTDRIVILQVQRAQQRFERQSLNRQRAEYYSECSQHNEAAIWKRI